MLISATNTYQNLSTRIGTDLVRDPRITNPDIVAGKLNFDSLIAGLNHLELHQFIANEQDVFDFDVIDRQT
jgi:hypothetical protein